MAGSHVTGSTSADVSRLDASTPLCGKSAFMEIQTAGQGQLPQHHSGACSSPSPIGGAGGGSGCGGYGTSPASSTATYHHVRPSPPSGYHHLHSSLSVAHQHQQPIDVGGFINSSQVRVTDLFISKRNIKFIDICRFKELVSINA